jgi:hypothetical protein
MPEKNAYEVAKSLLTSEAGVGNNFQVHARLPFGQTFEGSTRDAFIAMLFLHHKYPEQCTLLGRAVHEVATTPKIHDIEELLEWEKVAIVFEDGKLKSPYPTIADLGSALGECRRGKRPFTLAMFIFVSYSGRAMHANFIVFNNNSYTIERFEPYGITPSCFPHREGDLALLGLAHALYGEKVGTVMSPPPPDLGAIQVIDEENIDRFRTEDPVGFCLGYSVFFADCRMASPLLAVQDVPKAMIFIAQNFGTHVRDYIRAYTEFFRTHDNLLIQGNQTWDERVQSLRNNEVLV